MKNSKLINNRGITLIALIITIIVLLILAGITINLIIGERGIINKAKGTQLVSDQASVKEYMQLKALDINTGAYLGEEASMIELMKAEGILNDNLEINTEKLTGSLLGTGRGSGTNDVYKLEKTDEGYEIVYYDKSGNKTSLGVLENLVITLEETDSKYFDITPDGTISFKSEYDYYNIINKSDSYNNMNDSETEYAYYGYWHMYTGKYWTNFPEETVVIPKQVNGIPVKTIGARMFGRTKGIKKIVIPEGVVSIGTEAFIDSIDLEEIVFPNSVEEINYDWPWNCLLYGCKSLKKLEYAKEYTKTSSNFYGSSSYLALSFYNNSRLEEVNISDEVENIVISYMYNNYSLPIIKLPKNLKILNIESEDYLLPGTIFIIEEGNNVPEIRVGGKTTTTTMKNLWNQNDEKADYCMENGVIYNKDKTVLIRATNQETIVVPNTVTKIEDLAFAGCDKLKNITIPDSVTSIGKYAFKLCYKPMVVEIPSTTKVDSTTFLDSGVMRKEDIFEENGMVYNKDKTVLIRAKNEETVTIPSTVTTIKEYSFSNCTELKNIVIPETVTSIEKYAFDNCINLSKIEFKKDTRVKSETFNGCDNLKEVIFNDTNDEIIKSTLRSNKKSRNSNIEY